MLSLFTTWLQQPPGKKEGERGGGGRMEGRDSQTEPHMLPLPPFSWSFQMHPRDSKSGRGSQGGNLLHGACWFVVNVLCGFLEAGWCQNGHTPHLLPSPFPGSNGAHCPTDEQGPHSGFPWPLAADVQTTRHSACSHRPRAASLLEQPPHTNWTHGGLGQESAQWQEQGESSSLPASLPQPAPDSGPRPRAHEPITRRQEGKARALVLPGAQQGFRCSFHIKISAGLPWKSSG